MFLSSRRPISGGGVVILCGRRGVVILQIPIELYQHLTPKTKILWHELQLREFQERMCTLEKQGSVYVLTLTGNDQHRLSTALLDSIKDALHRLRSEISAGATSSALITTAQGNFFSNGYDLAWAAKSPADRPQIISLKLRSVIRDLISLPMPTVAAVTGHASASGFILALSHDYVLMRKDRGFLYMSELDIGMKVPAWFMAILKCKVGSPVAWRDIVLRATKLTAVVAAERGIIDSAHDSTEETVKAALKLGEELTRKKWDGHVYGENRITLFGDVLGSLGFDETVEDENGRPISISRL